MTDCYETTSDWRLFKTCTSCHSSFVLLEAAACAIDGNSYSCFPLHRHVLSFLQTTTYIAYHAGDMPQGYSIRCTPHKSVISECECVCVCVCECVCVFVCVCYVGAKGCGPDVAAHNTLALSQACIAGLAQRKREFAYCRVCRCGRCVHLTINYLPIII